MVKWGAEEVSRGTRPQSSERPQVTFQRQLWGPQQTASHGGHGASCTPRLYLQETHTRLIYGLKIRRVSWLLKNYHFILCHLFVLPAQKN